MMTKPCLLSLCLFAGGAAYGATPASGATPAPAAPAPALPVAAVPTPDLALYRLDPALDTAIAVGGAALWTGAFFVVSPQQKNRICDPCDPAELNALDRPFVRFHDPAWRWPGNVAYFLPAAAFIVLDIRDVGWRRWRVWMTDFLVLMEAMVLQGVVTEVFRRTVLRPRPFLYEAGVYSDERGEGEATFSFYSGHVSSVFTLATGLAYTWTLRHPRSRWLAPLWIGAFLVASLSPISRVASGDHFPTDVLVGSVVGTAFGLGWPALRHRLYERDRKLASLSLQPSFSPGSTGISLAGRF